MCHAYCYFGTSCREPAHFVCLALLHLTCELEGSMSYKQLAFGNSPLDMYGITYLQKAT